jgi:hypothetical protein
LIDKNRLLLKPKEGLLDTIIALKQQMKALKNLENQTVDKQIFLTDFDVCSIKSGGGDCWS